MTNWKSISAKMCPRVRAAVAKIKRNRRWPMLDRLPIPNWTRNRITLLGDAAHPMLQYIAQGACQALEDAVCLGENLKNTVATRRARSSHTKNRASSALLACKASPGFLARSNTFTA